MGSLFQAVTHNWSLAVVGTLLIGLVIDFVRRFLGPARQLSRALNESIGALEAIGQRGRGDVTELADVSTTAMKTASLAHLWREYAKTLHPQREPNPNGSSTILRWRATALAETFFTEQAIVDSRLGTEFFKHLPGICTGLGIIGTFTGLISGLTNFNVSLEPAKAQEQLGNLVKSVGDAFYVSGAAIVVAISITGVEKWYVTSCYRKAERLRELIDSLFKAGAGEEYLERLMVASETSATQAAHIKDALVSDLKLILDEITNRQIEAQSLSTGQISGDVGRAIADTLAEPMGAISAAVKNVSATQGDAVNRMLTDVLAGFTGQMREMFGGQMSGMSELLKQTSESMQATAVQFGQLAANMDAAGTSTVDAMGERLNRALEAMEARQQVMNSQMGLFVEQIRSLVAESQSESSRKLQEVLGNVGVQVTGIVEELRRQAEHSAESQGQRQERFERSTGEAIGSLSTHMESLLRQSVETNRSLQATISSLAGATDKAIAGMNSGAETLYLAANDFAKAGQGVSETMQSSTKAVDSIKAAVVQLTLATSGTKAILEDYGRSRTEFAQMVSDLKLTLDNSKRDATVTGQLVSRIEMSAAQLIQVQKQSEDYLKGVSQVLVTTHASFAENITKTLREGNRSFQAELSSAVQLLSGAIKELGDVLDEAPRRK